VKRKVYDCFLYSGESKLLKSRLAYLSSTVDYFIIGEQAYTFQNTIRVLDHKMRNEIMTEYGEKIRWLLDFEMLSDLTPWQRESRARNLLAEGLYDCAPSDLVLISDLDEIPNSDVIKQITKVNLPAVCKQELRVFDPHWKSSVEWLGTVVTNFDPDQNSIQKLRELGTFWWKHQDLTILEGAGWHLTSIGSIKNLKNKLGSFSHTELTNYIFASRINLFFLIKFGIAIQGNEVYKLKVDLPGFLKPICTKRHRLDLLRMFLGLIFRPIVRFIFKSQVGTLKIV
jgi:beta-1,4-mannosyl-glycoprotein beta-1,4-N-acetylglucosaminyltransferase